MRFLFGATIFLSSTLVFLVQPMVAKAMLPRFGGAAGVWTTSMLFFQTVLLLGYLYAYGLSRLRPRLQMVIHTALLVASLPFLPVSLKPGFESTPVLQILTALSASVGLPYFLLTTTSPLLQSWYAASGAGTLPYRLFAVSNAASLAGLLAYPFLIEPNSALSGQLGGWSAAFALFVVVGVGVAVFSGLRAAVASTTRLGLPEGWGWWLVLAATPAALWLATANQMSQTLAPIPLLWIVPLSIYLLSLVLAFDREQWYRPRVFRWLLPLAALALGQALQQYGWSRKLIWGALLFNGALLVCCWFCHAEMARRKPSAEHLTSFYVVVAAGGALGALFVSMLAPLVFSDYLEFQVGVIACLLLAVGLLYGYGSLRHMVRLGIVAMATFVALSYVRGDGKFRGRNFYGVLEVEDLGAGEGAHRVIYHGSIRHGVQFLSPKLSRLPTSYYGLNSGAGRELAAIPPGNRRIGVIGLGAGTLATYARRGDTFRFYDINPMVADLARTRFRYLAECEGTVEVVIEDARLALAREAPQQYDLLAVDAFSGDAVPVHLLTREAFALYVSHLKPGGVLAVHVSSKYLDLVPVVLRLGAAVGREARVVANAPEPLQLVNAATWVVMKRSIPPRVDPRLWTDQVNNLLEVLK
ncbi:MAG: spermidine synthase [Bryobacteraceae bacterium]